MKNNTDNRKKYNITKGNYSYLKKHNLNNSDGINSILRIGISSKEKEEKESQQLIKIEKELNEMRNLLNQIVDFLID